MRHGARRFPLDSPRARLGLAAVLFVVVADLVVLVWLSASTDQSLPPPVRPVSSRAAHRPTLRSSVGGVGDLGGATRAAHQVRATAARERSAQPTGGESAAEPVAARMAGYEPLDGDRGTCVLTASVAAFDGQIGQTAYTASKAGVSGMTLVAARDLASWQIRVNTIAPGIMETPMLGRLRDDVREGLAAQVPHPERLGDPAEFGKLAVDILRNGYLNGQTIRLDGSIRMAPR